jgi:hypothetical protein
VGGGEGGLIERQQIVAAVRDDGGLSFRQAWAGYGGSAELFPSTALKTGMTARNLPAHADSLEAEKGDT